MSKANNHSNPQQYQSSVSFFAKVFWTLVGNMILFVSAVFIIQHKGSMFGAVDIVFWSNIAAMIGARYLDIRFWSGTTATGEPATMRDWQKYAIVLFAGAAIAWIVLHIVHARMAA